MDAHLQPIRAVLTASTLLVGAFVISRSSLVECAGQRGCGLTFTALTRRTRARIISLTRYTLWHYATHRFSTIAIDVLPRSLAH